VSAPGTTGRPDPTKCWSGKHDWIPENLRKGTDGRDRCKPCNDERNKAVAEGLEQRHPNGAQHCRRGHAYTPENTRKKVRFRNGKKEIVRQCVQCEKDSRKTTYVR